MPLLDLEAIEPGDIIEDEPPSMRLPAFLLAKGVVPNSGDLLPGDIVLFAPRQPAWHQRRIIGVQSQSYAEATAGFTHAAVYVGDFQVCEALWRGVAVSSVLDPLAEYRLLVRRLPNASLEQGYRVAVRSLQRLTSAYSATLIVRIVWHAVKGLHRQRLGGLTNRLVGGRATICSMLCTDAVAEATRRLIVPLQNGTVLPADLASTDELATVRVRWRRLPGRA